MRSMISVLGEIEMRDMMSDADPTIPILPSLMETTPLSMVSPVMVWTVAPTRKTGWSCSGAEWVRSWALATDVASAMVVMSVVVYFMMGLSMCY